MICPVWRRVIINSEFDLVRSSLVIMKPSVKEGDR